MAAITAGAVAGALGEEEAVEVALEAAGSVVLLGAASKLRADCLVGFAAVSVALFSGVVLCRRLSLLTSSEGRGGRHRYNPVEAETNPTPTQAKQVYPDMYGCLHMYIYSSVSSSSNGSSTSVCG